MSQPFMQTTRCTVSTLSPVHIGCGEDYYPTNYVIDGGLLHHFSEEGLLTALALNEKSQLAKMADATGDDGIKKLQAFIYGKKASLSNYATHRVPVSEKLEAFYRSRIGQTAQHEGGGKKVNNKLEIARHAFNPYSQLPYFPGSSIKGSIRTALLNALNNGNPLPIRLDNNRDAPRGESEKLQKRLFDYQAISDNPEKGIKGDSLRLLKIGDATYSHADHLHGMEIRVAVNRKNKPSKFEARGPSQFLECLPANRSRSLSFDLALLADKNSQTRWALRDICLSCNEFFVPQLKSELAMLQQLNYANTGWITGLEKLLANELSEAFNNQQAFLLRIGQHGGAESNTLDGVRHIKIMQGKGNAPKYLAKPTTVWLAADHKDQQHNLLPFGWVLVEVDAVELPQTHAFLKRQAEPDYQRHAQMQQLAQKQAEFLAQEREKLEIKARQAAEAAEHERQMQAEAAAKAEQWAALTEEQQVIAKLRQEYEQATPKTQPIGGILNQNLTAAIQQAAAWSSEDKQALRELGAEINKTLWGGNKKVRDRLKALQ